jgi:hypothetical protein
MFGVAKEEGDVMAQASGWLAIAAAGLMATQGCADEATPSQHGTGAAAGAAGEGGAASGGGSTGGWATGGSGGSGASSGGAGGTSGSAGAGPGASCLVLDACCEELGASMYSACKSVVQMGQEATCDSILQSYHQNGYCTGSTACAVLATCCPELPPGQGWKDTCDYYVEINNAPQCEHLIGDYQLAGYCA